MAGASTSAAATSGMENAITDALIEEEPRYKPMTDEEMEAELDAIEADDDDSDSDSDKDDSSGGKGN